MVNFEKKQCLKNSQLWEEKQRGKENTQGCAEVMNNNIRFSSYFFPRCFVPFESIPPNELMFIKTTKSTENFSEFLERQLYVLFH